MCSLCAIGAIAAFILLPCSFVVAVYLCRGRRSPPANQPSAGDDPAGAAGELWSLVVAEMARSLRERSENEENESRERSKIVAEELERCETLLAKCSLVLTKEHMRPRYEPAHQPDETWEWPRWEAGVKGMSNEGLGETDTNVEMEEGCQGGAGKGEPDQSQHTRVAIPFNTGDGGNAREVPIHCAICLAEYEVSDEVCWASNPNCPHVFHRDCMSRWLTSFLWVKVKRRAVSTEVNCPMCRQNFFKIEKSEDPEAVGFPRAPVLSRIQAS